jgi:hypothetical protein
MNMKQEYFGTFLREQDIVVITSRRILRITVSCFKISCQNNIQLINLLRLQ